MNQFILNIMIVYCIASIVYFIYSLYLRFSNSETIDDLFKENEDLKTIGDKYNKIKRNRIAVFIIGIILGLIYLVISDYSNIPNKVNNKTVINDISDIRVI